MATSVTSPDSVIHTGLTNYLISMARTVEGAVNRGIEALLQTNPNTAAALASEIFLNEPRINEMEMVIDEHAIRMLHRASLPDPDIRLIVSTLRINNDLERMGDLAVNIGQRVVTLSQIDQVQTPPEFKPMSDAVRAMVGKSLGALIFRNVTLATQVLESDDVVDQYRDLVTERLLEKMTSNPAQVHADMQFVLASRYLERIADHCTNIAEEIVYWVRGQDVRHGRALQLSERERALDAAEAEWADPA